MGRELIYNWIKWYGECLGERFYMDFFDRESSRLLWVFIIKEKVGKFRGNDVMCFLNFYNEFKVYFLYILCYDYKWEYRVC